MKLFRYLILITTVILLIGCGDNDEKFSIETSGSIETSEVEIRSKVAGEILEYKVFEGQEVKSGDVLAMIDDADLQIQKSQAVAALEGAKAKYQTILEGVREEDKAQLEEIVRQAQVNFENAKNDFERMRSLFNQQSVSQKLFEDAEFRYQVAEAQLAAAKENLKKAVAGARQSEIRAAKAAVDQIKAQVDAIDKRINDAVIKTPIDGIVALLNFERGEIVNVGSVITRIINLKDAWTKIYVNEPDLAKVSVGQEVVIKVDGFENREFVGRVAYISPDAEFTPKNIQTKEERVKLVYAVKISVSNEEKLLKQGMQCDVMIK